MNNIIWATGYRTDYSWIKIPQGKDRAGNLNHVRGVTNVEGLYTLGLPWQSHRGSTLIGGVGKDASYICGIISCNYAEFHRSMNSTKSTAIYHKSSAML